MTNAEQNDSYSDAPRYTAPAPQGPAIADAAQASTMQPYTAAPIARQPTHAPMVPASPAYLRVDDKQVHVAYILMIFFSAFGVHKFYLGRVGLGIAYIFTAGFFGIGTLVDIFTLNGQVLNANAKRRMQGL